MTVVTMTICNGCARELPRGPVAQLVRTNGLGGAELPEPGAPYDLCLECAQAAAETIAGRRAS